LALLALVAILFLVNWDFDRSSPSGSTAASAAPAPDVQLSIPSGSYKGALNIALSSPHPDAAIYFTTDGSIPTAENGTLYTGPIHLPDDQPRTHVLRARAVLPDGEEGTVTDATYFLNMDADIPLVSIIVDPEYLWHDDSGIFANPGFYGREAEREADLYYYDPAHGTGVQAPAGLRVHGAGSRQFEKLSMRLYFRDEYGEPYLEYPVFPDAPGTRYKRLVVHDGGQEFPAVSVNGTLLRNHLVGNLAREAGAYATYSRPALIFINGELWGIYNIRERIDERYLEENFQIEEADLLSGFEHRLDAQAGDLVHWDNLVEYVAAHDLTDEENYAYVQTQVNLDNLIDYALIQIITANVDWPHNNQLKFRDRAGGRWHWMFWDSDYAFGLMSDSYIEKEMYGRIFDPVDERQEQSTLLLRKLLQNPQFKNRFLARLADLLNTVFAPQNVLDEIDRLAAAIEDEISYETRRWPGAGNWEASIEYLREFARQRPDYVRQHTIATFDLPGTAQLTINKPAGGLGTVRINDGPPLSAEELPWQGAYFQDVELQLTAVPDPGYLFDGWEPASLPQTPVLTLPVDGDITITPRFVGVDANSAAPGSVRFASYGSRYQDPAPADGMVGDWISLHVRAPGGVDLRGWRITDNDSLENTDEGSLIFGDHPALSDVPLGTTLLLIVSETPANDRRFREDDLSPSLDSRLILYAGNDVLDTRSDPWFALGEKDTLVLLAPGPAAGREDDIAIDSLTLRDGVTPQASGQ
jgi:hypothetical protein